jgi:hypothetical protein
MEDNWLAPVVRRKLAKYAAHVLGVLWSIGDISPIGTFLTMRLQWLLRNTFKALPVKYAFSEGFDDSKTKDRWTTTILGATYDTHFDVALLCKH